MKGTEERMKMVVAMDYIMTHINDEDIMESWLMCGVADCEIDHDQWSVDYSEDYYMDNDNFSYLMGLFVRCMKRAEKSGGLYCDRVTSES